MITDPRHSTHSQGRSSSAVVRPRTPSREHSLTDPYSSSHTSSNSGISRTAPGRTARIAVVRKLRWLALLTAILAGTAWALPRQQRRMTLVGDGAAGAAEAAADGGSLRTTPVESGSEQQPGGGGPRVAVCFFGLTRSLRWTLPSVRSRLLGVLREAGMSVDVFVHTYSLAEVSSSSSSFYDAGCGRFEREEMKTSKVQTAVMLLARTL